jgi:hypothetical protein
LMDGFELDESSGYYYSSQVGATTVEAAPSTHLTCEAVLLSP